MKHIPKDQCGIENYRCVGIPFPIEQTLLSCRSTDFDKQSIPDSYKAGDTDANNFYNIPRSFLGVVNSTPYKDLQGSVDQYIGQCMDSYDVFSQGGFADYYKKIGEYLDITPLSCYYNSAWVPQEPGVLLPVASLSQFNPSPVLTVPSWVGIMNTVVQSTVSNTTFQVNQRLAKALANGTGGCGSGFGITAYFSTGGTYAQSNKSVDVYVSVQGGTIRCGQVDSDIDGSQQQRISVSKKTDTFVIDIHANLKYNAATQEFELMSYAIGQMSPISNVSLYIGSVIVSCYSQRNVPAQYILKIHQAVCSPVMLCDPDKTKNLPEDDDDTTIFVYSYNAKSEQLGWLPVVDC